MSIFENIKIAIEGLRLNKMRSFLTMLGIIIGISSVIGIWTIGHAMSNSVSKGFDSFGNTVISVSVTAREKDQNFDYTPDINDRDKIKQYQIDEMLNRYSDYIKSISISGMGASGKVFAGRAKSNVRIESVTAGAKDVNNLKMVSGRFIDDKDVNQQKEVAVISDKVVNKIYGGKVENALGSEIEINTNNSGIRTYLVVGVYKYEPIDFGIFGGDTSGETTNVYIPMTVGNRQFGTSNTVTESYQTINVNAKSREVISQTSAMIEKFFNDNYYNENENYKVTCQTIESQISQINKVMGTIKLAIGAIAAISLIVGGIGVMNILLVSVTERTREIGIRKALGATNSDIRGQFIIESIIICSIGGLIGILFGTSLGYGGSILLKSPTLPSAVSVLVAVGFSMVIGIFFGYYPANKAAKLNPIDALRYE
ncbi:ABC transporter permease [Peptoniphilus sp. oral taxon 386]|uniref:ABC transporter permease n=1 Tax=Peptoniphilus sp. oral taxon 386 TaxID=652713 RepID=UPI0002EEB379|nr:ABC transporter permease [Peptoniphilus sp. oral taxon 386]